MKPSATHLTVAATIVAATCTGITASAAENTWTLKTDDTHLELTVRDNKAFITVLKNPAQGWNWTPAPSEVPLLERIVVGGAPRPLTWSFREATTAADTNGTILTLRFTSADPALELKSVWRARPGVGPVEHQPTIRNDSTGAVAFAEADLVAANLSLVSDQQARLFPWAGGRLGHGEGNPLPYQMLQVGTAHGVYLAYDYGCGQFVSTVTSNQVASRWWAAGIKNTATAAGETFRCPGFMLLTYRGDEDDGANHFRRWFWTYEITRSLYETPTDPPIGTCEYSAETDARPDLYIEWIKKRNYVDWGVRLWKTDAWHMQKGHARSDELGEVCRANGLELCLYWNGRRTEEELVAEWNKSKFNYYRTDDYGAGPPFFVNDYRSFMDFNRKIDSLYRKCGIKYENCSNGGNIRTLDVFRRMTWMTHSDHSDLGPFFKNVYAWSYLMCPIQLRSDYNHLFEDVANIRGQLLGSILLSLYNKDKPMSDLGNERVKRVFHLYNTKQRAVLRGADVYRILPPLTQKNQWFGIQYYNTFINKGSVLLWQNGGPTSQVVKLKGLDRSKTYQLTFEDAKDKNGEMTGAQLMDEGLNITMGPNASEIVWINCPEFSASHASLLFEAAGPNDKVSPKQVTLAYSRGPGTDKAFAVEATHPWVKIGPVTGAGDGQTFAVSVSPGDWPSDFYHSMVVVSRSDMPERLEIPVRLRLGSPLPKTMAIRPPSAGCVGKGELQFAVEVADQFGDPCDGRIQWSVSGGGKIGDKGLFQSEGTSGVYTVTAAVAGHPTVTTTAQVRVIPVNVACWKLDETSGTVAADAWGSFPGTLVGGPTWESGKCGGALRFNGKGQYVDTKWTMEGLQFPCTFAFWVNPADVQEANADIFGNHDARLGVVMQQNGGEINKYTFGYNSTAGPGGGAGPVQLAADEWQYVAVVCDGKNIVIYLDGKESARGAGKNPPAPNPRLGFRLGSGYSEGRFFNGALDDFRIYARALSVEEINALMTAKDGK